jgi:hypothetical protein
VRYGTFTLISRSIITNFFPDWMSLLHIWSTALLEKLRVAHLVKKFIAFCEIQRLITVFIKCRHTSLS